GVEPPDDRAAGGIDEDWIVGRIAGDARPDGDPAPRAAVRRGAVRRDADLVAAGGQKLRPGDDRVAGGVEREAGATRRGGGVGNAPFAGGAGKLLPAAARG